MGAPQVLSSIPRSRSQPYPMHSIIQLFIRHGGLLTLGVFEVLSFFLIASYNDPQRQISSASWVKYAGVLLNWKTDVLGYFALDDENERLRNEIAFLETQLSKARILEVPKADSLTNLTLPDSSGRLPLRPEYRFITARVISNSVSGRNNWMMINRGRKDGVEENTGVITARGVAGVVRYVSDDFSLVMSVLHRQARVSAALKGYDYFGSLVWEGDNPQKMTLTDIPYHLPVHPRDTVVVSKYSLLFPAGHLAGTVDTAYRMPGSNFLFIRVNLSQSPAAIDNVYVVTNKYSDQIDQLQQAVKDEQQ